MAALSSFVITDFRIDYTQLGFLIGLYLLPGIVIAYPSGLLGQYFGDKRIAVLGMTFMVIGGLITATGEYSNIFSGRLISGVGAVLLNVLLTKMATDWFTGREIGTALALLVSSWPIGIGLALITLPWLAVQTTVGLAFASTGVVAALVLVLIAGIYYVPPSEVTPLPSAAKEPLRLSLSEFGLVSLAGIIWMLFNVGYILVVSFGPALLMSKGLSQQESGFVISWVSWTVIVTIPLGGVLVDRVRRRNHSDDREPRGLWGWHCAHADHAVIGPDDAPGCGRWSAGRCNDGAAERGASPARSGCRDGSIFYLVLRWRSTPDAGCWPPP